MPTNLISRVQDSINSQRNGFCSRSTRVTTINASGPVNPEDVVSYVDCGGKTNTVPYDEIFANNGYINDCVQGGCSIKSTGESGTPNRYFVQFGTTDCEVLPPTNLSFTPCAEGPDVIVRSTEFSFSIGGVYNMTFGEYGQGCYTFNGFTSSTTNDTIQSINGGFNNCKTCGG
jgi:hypothetical protein